MYQDKTIKSLRQAHMAFRTNQDRGSSLESVRLSEYFFEALDHQLVGTGPDSWITEVCGVHDSPDEIWVQLVAAGDPLQGVTLRLSRHTTAAQALHALGSWSTLPPDERPAIVTVKPLS